ncbi:MULTISPECIES: outer membrane beta-barrel protein [Niastella]|uniref:TonB-dependent receptor n=1 Tax=Niastella soli TaxID=2821487 RepID=A0ABS3Z627_9BACT|nr:outer membrane beta-barrel protein [Niastella soli]MBO9205528.1 TonB-dependent receptor [Niastella soli]
MKNSITLLYVLLLLIPAWLHAQTTLRISGKVLSETGKPLPAASVALIHLHDSLQVLAGTTNNEGLFEFDNVPADSLLVAVTAIGYRKYYSAPVSLQPESSPLLLPAIQLQKLDGKTLQQVTVVGKKNLVEQEIDKMVVNVDAMITAAGSTALDVLERTPGLTVDENGNINLKGKSGVTVYINNKPTYLSGVALANYLRSLPASQLDKIELMSNPSSRYDAAGSGGVVNIRLKRSKVKGFNGNLSASFGQSIYWQTNESLNLNYRNDRLTIFGSIGYNRQNGYRRLDVERRYFRDDHELYSIFQQTTDFKTSSKSGNAQLGMDYSLTDKTSIGFVWNGAHYRSSEKREIASKFFNPHFVSDSLISADYDYNARFTRSGINLNLTHRFDTSGQMLNVDVDYIWYSNSSNMDFLNYTYLPDLTLTRLDHLQGHVPTGMNIYSSKADYTFFPAPKLKVETGVKASYISTDNEANYFDIINDERLENIDLTNHFSYKENINAAYINTNRSFNRFSFQAGLRLENTMMKGHQLGNTAKPDSSFKRSYTNLFPTLYLTYKLDKKEKHQLNLSYGRRITRPYYQDLNPFIAPLDKFTYFAGNPFLLPEFSNNIELSWFFKKKILTTLMYNRATNWQSQTSEQTSTVYINRPGNIGKRKFMGISVNASLQPTKWWTLNIYTEVINNSFKGDLYGSQLDEGSTYWYINTNQQFRFNKGWSGEISGFYITRSVSGQYLKDPLWQANAGVQKNIMNNRLTLKLTGRDIFHTLKPNARVAGLNNATSSIRNMASTQVIVLGATYNFGKTFNSARRRRTGGAQYEQNRIKDMD